MCRARSGCRRPARMSVPRSRSSTRSTPGMRRAPPSGTRSRRRTRGGRRRLLRLDGADARRPRARPSRRAGPGDGRARHARPPRSIPSARPDTGRRSAGAARLGHKIHRRTRPGKADATGVASLTARELEIARLVVDRKTNPEIATALFLSPKTVESAPAQRIPQARRVLTRRRRTRRRAVRIRRAPTNVSTALPTAPPNRVHFHGAKRSAMSNSLPKNAAPVATDRPPTAAYRQTRNRHRPPALRRHPVAGRVPLRGSRDAAAVQLHCRASRRLGSGAPQARSGHATSALRGPMAWMRCIGTTSAGVRPDRRRRERHRLRQTRMGAVCTPRAKCPVSTNPHRFRMPSSTNAHNRRDDERGSARLGRH